MLFTFFVRLWLEVSGIAYVSTFSFYLQKMRTHAAACTMLEVRMLNHASFVSN